MNVCQLSLLKALARFDWNSSDVCDVATSQLQTLLLQTPIQSTEVQEAFNAFIIQIILRRQSLRRIFNVYLDFAWTCMLLGSSQPGDQSNHRPEFDLEVSDIMQDPDSAALQATPPTTRGVPRFLYVLHLFSGVKC